MRRLLFVVAALVGCTSGARPTCDYSPADLMFDDTWVCNRDNPLGVCDRTATYPKAAIHDALIASPDHKAFLKDTGSCLMAEDDIYSYRGDDYFYWNVCKPTKNFVKTIVVQNTMCYVMEPQQLYYATCGDPTSRLGNRCRLGYTFLPNYYCVQSGYTKRKVLVFCPKLLPKCQYHEVTLPSTCSCKGFFCGVSPKIL
ncbi:hypothetical protein ScPMuIL_012811 [Solemya velum]